jgi:hypothetical protein
MMHLLGLPVEIDETLPPGVVKLRAPDGTEVITGVSVDWLYQANAKMPPHKRHTSRWVVRDLDDLTEPLKREGVK